MVLRRLGENDVLFKVNKSLLPLGEGIHYVSYWLERASHVFKPSGISMK